MGYCLAGGGASHLADIIIGGHLVDKSMKDSSTRKFDHKSPTFQSVGDLSHGMRVMLQQMPSGVDKMQMVCV